MSSSLRVAVGERLVLGEIAWPVRGAGGEIAWPVRGAVAVRWELMQPLRAGQGRTKMGAWAKTQRHQRTQAWTRCGRTHQASWGPARWAAMTAPPGMNAAAVAPGQLENANATSDASPLPTAARPTRCAAARRESARRFAFRRASVSVDDLADRDDSQPTRSVT